MPPYLSPQHLRRIACTAILLCCSQVAGHDMNDDSSLHIAGSATVLHYLRQLVAPYRQLAPTLQLVLDAGGSDHGYAGMLTGLFDIGMMSRPLTTAERDQLGDRVQAVVIGFDVVTPVVSRALYEAGIQTIELDDMRALYSDKIHNWQQLGGPDRSVLLADKNRHHGTRTLFMQRLFGRHDTPYLPAAIILEDNRDVVQLLTASDQAIGYLSQAYRDEYPYYLAIRQGDSLFAPDATTIRSGGYPLARRLWLLLPDPAPVASQHLLDFILSKKGQFLLRQSGYIPLL